MQMLLSKVSAARIVIDQPLPIADIIVGDSKGVKPAHVQRNKFDALITEAELEEYASTRYVLVGVCINPTPKPTFLFDIYIVNHHHSNNNKYIYIYHTYIKIIQPS